VKNAINRFLVSSLALLILSAFISAARVGRDDNRVPDVPDTIGVPIGHKVHFHGFARGVQIYTWNGASWGSAVPEATLFDDDGNVVVTHFAVFDEDGKVVGPAWESNSGSRVVGALPPVGIIVDEDSIPWLRLTAVEELTHGPGILANTTFIHRLNTVGGKAPKVNGTVIGQVARVPYTADYFFYRKTNKTEDPV